MGDFSKFFRESDISLGIFYPKHYVIATFPTYSAAKNAHQSLRHAGFPEDEVMVATGKEVLAFFKHFREDAGLGHRDEADFSVLRHRGYFLRPGYRTRPRRIRLHRCPEPHGA